MTQDAYGFDERGYRRVQAATRQTLDQTAGPSAGNAGRPEQPAPIIVELLLDIEPDDYSLQDARQVRYDATDGWVTVRSVKVRKITPLKLLADTGNGPARHSAKFVHSLGWCIEGAAAADTTTVTNNDACCGKCRDPADWIGVDISGTEYPRAVTVSLPALTCCGYSEQEVRMILHTDDLCSGVTGSDKYEILDGSCTVQALDCTDGTSTVTWTLDPVTRELIATHSVDGVVAKYTPVNYYSLWCPTRFVLDEATTPQHTFDCSICPRELCVVPAPAATLDDDCHDGSDHKDLVPTQWELKREYTLGVIDFEETATLVWRWNSSVIKSNCVWAGTTKPGIWTPCGLNGSSASNYSQFALGYCKTADEWQLSRWLGTCVIGNTTYPDGTCNSSGDPSWSDATFDPQGVNTITVNENFQSIYGVQPVTYTLTPIDLLDGSPVYDPGASHGLGSGSAPPPPP